MNRIAIAIVLGALAVPSGACAMTYSAIALSPSTGGWGVANESLSQVDAEQKAVDRCRKYSSEPADCRSVSWARGGWCAALSMHHTANRSVAWGAVARAALQDAQTDAKSLCMKYVHDGGDCDDNTVHVCSH